MSETKTLRVAVKDAEQGQVEAVFATLNVVDHDGDVTVPGAFKDGQQVRISAYGHGSWTGALPVGKGVIRSSESEAVLQGEFFMDTQHGRDTFLTVKQLGDLGEWSYGYDVLDSEEGDFEGKQVRFLKSLDVLEVSPVLLGAGIGTRTLAAKAADAKTAIPPHSTKTSDAPWDGPSAWNRIDAARGELRAATAWVDPTGDPDAKASYKFIHHEISADGAAGAANIVGCIAGIAVLNGGRGGTTIPDGDKQGVYNHLARHLKDAGRTPPGFNPKSLSFPDRVELVLGDMLGAVDHARDWGLGGDVKVGRVLSAANHGRLTQMAAAMSQLQDELQTLLAETDPNKTRDVLFREYMRFQQHLAAN